MANPTKKAGYNVEILFANLVNFSDCEAITNSIIERFGHIDILVNNAGSTCDVSLKQMEPHHWQQVVDANLTSTFNITRHVLPFMIEKNSVVSCVFHPLMAEKDN